MFSKMLSWVKSTILKLLGQESTELTISPKMENLIDLWARLYEGTEAGESLKLPVSIASEFARLVVVESEISITGGSRADWMEKQLSPFLQKLQEYVEYACAMGGEVFKPYVSGDSIIIDTVQADSFFPTAFDTSGRMTGAVFVEQIVRGNCIYTRAESHEFMKGREVIRNKAFSSTTNAALGKEIDLTAVPEWAEIAPEIAISEIDRPLFAYFRIPLANNRERHSPLGVSVFANAVQSIRDADEQYKRLIWEYDGGQLAIDVAASAIRKAPDGSLSMDKREQRLYRRNLETGIASGDFYHAFAPSLRDSSYIAGLDSILKKVEFQCNLAFGTFSDPASVEKTATEMKISKQRSFSAVSSIQHSLENALDDLAYAVDKLASLYQLAPPGTYKTSYQWHDSVLQDEETQRVLDREDAISGFIPKWQYNTKWRAMTEAEAKAAVQEASSEGGGITPLTFGGDA